MATKTATPNTVAPIAIVPPKPGHSLTSEQSAKVRALVAEWADVKAVELTAESTLADAKTALLTARVRTARVAMRLQDVMGGSRDDIAKLLGYNTKGPMNQYFLVGNKLGDRARLAVAADVTDADRDAVAEVWAAEAERQAKRRADAAEAKAKQEADAKAAVEAAEAAKVAAEAATKAAEAKAAEAEAEAAKAKAEADAKAEETPAEETPEAGTPEEESTPEETPAAEVPAEETPEVPEVPAKVIAPTFGEVLAKLESLANTAATYAKAEDAKAPTKAEADRFQSLMAEVAATIAS